MAFKNITVRVEGNFASITIARPKALNAVNRETLQELSQIIAELGQNAEVRGAILTGSGDKAFIAGADVTEFIALTPLEAQALAVAGQRVTRLMEQLPFPLLAAVNGYCLGGGFELALGCDFILASTNAVFGLPEVSLGLIPGWGGTQRLGRLIGPNRARQLIFSGARLKAPEAQAWGIVNAVCESADLLPQAKKLLEDVAKNAPLAVRQAKRAINEGLQVDLDRALALESSLFGVCFATQDVKEGILAFNEKRQAKWRGQ